MNNVLNKWLEEFPLIAILRGIHPDDCLEIGQGLFQIGFRLIEIPLNSPEPFKSIQKLSLNVKGSAIVGAGTILQENQLELLSDSGGKLAVMPHVDLELIRKAKTLNLLCIPGVSTPTEAFAALNAARSRGKFLYSNLTNPLSIKFFFKSG